MILMMMVILLVVAVVVGLMGNYEMVIHQTPQPFLQNSLPSNLIKN